MARLVSVWDLSPDDAAQALTWLIDKLVLAITDDGYPPS
jgi:hypothetical protein